MKKTLSFWNIAAVVMPKEKIIKGEMVCRFLIGYGNL